MPDATSTKPPKRRHRWWKRLLFIVAILTGLGIITFALVFNLIPHPLAYCMLWADNAQRAPDPAGDATASELQTLHVDKQMRVEVSSPPVSLSVWIMEPRPASAVSGPQTAAPTPRASVLLLCGIHDSKLHMVGVGQHFAQLGYRAILVDLRGQGRSSGPYLTYGVKESRDLKEMLDRFAEMGLLHRPLVVMGVSYGAATAIQLAAIDPRVRAVVAVASFTSLRRIVPHYVRYYLPGLGWLVLDSSIQRAIDEGGRMAGFNPDDASPLQAITRTRCPVLLIQGSSDPKVQPWHSQALHAAAPDHSELQFIPGADHDNIMEEEHWPEVRDLADKWFAKVVGR